MAKKKEDIQVEKKTTPWSKEKDRQTDNTTQTIKFELH